ncbi:MAG TPA: CDP-alcohol phosphatidyltransferase family protein [Beutenbergiaceae bacterium]|nr:CDP-alcohol phosphatidyltransferase family protein [Beutenbergiaceae bacterium]
MVLGNRGRGFTQAIFGPLARGLLRLGVSPNTVTVLGTVVLMALALTLFPMGYLAAGALAIGLVVLCDSIDGIMAREAGHHTRFGSFLDSTLDRFADAAIYIGLLVYFAVHVPPPWSVAGVVVTAACLAIASVVSYARAKAESLQFTASVGVAERADRLILTLVATLIVGLGAPAWILVIALGVLALASAITVGQRIGAVARQDAHR